MPIYLPKIYTSSILSFICSWKFMLSSIEHENSFFTLGQETFPRLIPIVMFFLVITFKAPTLSAVLDEKVRYAWGWKPDVQMN